MSFLSILRIVILCVSLLFAVIALGLGAHVTFLIGTLGYSTETFTVLALATACLTVVTLPIMLIVDYVRKGAFTSMVLVELIWLGILWILWLATGANTANLARAAFPFGCNDVIFVELSDICYESLSIIAFSFLNFILLFGYSVTLLVFTLIGASRGQTVWTSTVKQTNFLAHANTKSNMPPYNNQVVPMQQPQVGSPAGYVYQSQIKPVGHPAFAEV